jgi:hypothetical protein
MKDQQLVTFPTNGEVCLDNKARKVAMWCALKVSMMEHQTYCHELRIWHQLDHCNILLFLGISFAWDCSMELSPTLISPYCKFGDAVQYLKENPHANRLHIVCLSSFIMIVLSIISL